MSELGKAVDTLLFALSKADRIPAVQRDEAVAFTRRVLEQALGRAVEPIYQVSAIAAERGHPASAGEGWHALVEALERLPRIAGGRLVQAAVDRGAIRLRERLAALIEEEHEALAAPLAESEARIAALGTLAGGADRAARELEPLLALAARDLALVFAERRRDFLTAAMPAADRELTVRFDDRLRHEAALELANAIARARLAPWLAESEREAEGAYRDVLARFAALAREFLERAAALAGVTRETLGLDATMFAGLQAPSGFYFTDLLRYHVSPYPWSGLVDGLLPRPIARRRRLGAARRYLAHLLDVNATRVESDLTNRVYESRTRVRTELVKVLHQVGRAAIVAAERGREARAAGEAAVASARERLARWRGELA